MADETVTPAAPPAAPPSETPPTPAPDPAGAPPTRLDEFRASMLQSLGYAMDKDGSVKSAPPAEAAPPIQGNSALITLADAVNAHEDRKAQAGNQPAAPVTPPSAAAPSTPPLPDPAAAKPVVVEKARSVDDIIRQTVEQTLSSQKVVSSAPPAPLAPAAPEPPKPDAYESNLLDEQRQELELLRFGEKKHPEKFKGRADERLAFFKELDAYIDTERKKDSERTFDDSDKEFTKWMNDRRPVFTSSEQLQLIREQATEDAIATTTKQFETKLDEIRRDQYALRVRPDIERSVTEFSNSAVNEFATAPEAHKGSLVPEIMEAVKKGGWASAREQFKFHAPLVEQVYNGAVALAGQFSGIIRGTTPINLENPDHGWLLQFIDHESKKFQKDSPDKTTRGGKTFMPWMDYLQLAGTNKAEAAKHFTFTEGDVRERLLRFARDEAYDQVGQKSRQLEEAGFKFERPQPKTGSHPPAPAQPPATTTTPPKAAPSSRPGAGSQGTQVGGGAFSSRDLAALTR